MPVNLLGIEVPDYPGQEPENSHDFTSNFLNQRINAGDPYLMRPVDIPNNVALLLDRMNQAGLQLRQMGTPIMAGDLILIGINRGGNNNTIQFITHSMIAISPEIWFGVNNIGTFMDEINQQQIPGNSFCTRREVDLDSLNVNFNLANRIVGNWEFDVYR